MSARVMVSVRVAASPKRAFDVFVRDIGVWWQANDIFTFTRRSTKAGRAIVEIEAGQGGLVTETGPDGTIFEIGRVTAWEPGALLGFTWRQASFQPDQMTRVEVRFEPVGAETRVTVQHIGWESVPAAHVARHGFPDGVFLRRHGEWWQTLLARFSARNVVRNFAGAGENRGA